jgi:hypothetical protein
MSEETILSSVTSALAVDGFEPVLTPKGAIFRGSVRVRDIDVRLRLEFRDLEFCEPPYLFIENPAALPRKVLPHLDEKSELCVVDRRQFVADRYHAAAEARGIVVRARGIIERGLTRHADDDIAEEFPQHWGGAGIGIEFGAYEGPTQQVADDGGFIRFRPGGGMTGWAILAKARLSFAENQKRPDTLNEFLEWAGYWDPTLPGKAMDALRDLSSADPHLIIVAPNGTVGFTLMVSSRGRAQVDALKRPDGWRRALRTPLVAALPIRRDHGYRADIDYALERSGDGTPPLSGKQVVLVGCGSIGGFLSRSLAQIGAGRGGGQIVLIDDERLATVNVGRHVLGVGDVGRLKAQACRDLIIRDLPGTAILARPFVVQTQRSLVQGADLTIDATGERGVGERLNAWMLEAQATGAGFPCLLHAWIEGAGAAVQSFMGSDAAFACLRCLKPDPTDAHSRFSALRDEAAVQLSGGGGEALFTPYGAAAPMMAAAMATQHAYDWVKGHPRPLLRTGRLDWASTKEVKPTNPTATKLCPACRRA